MPYETGALLEVRGERWQLTRVAPFGACTLLTLEGRDRSNATRSLRVLDPFDRPRSIGRRRIARRPRAAVLASALSAFLSARRPSGLWTAARATIDLWPYQLEPALAAIGGATRLLLADAVGLGKTIQAGLLLSELRERGWVERTLIVCPAGMRDTWARELHDRFAIAATVIDQYAIAERIASLPPGVNPWSGQAIIIASVDFIKRPEVLSAIEGEPIDLLIADEAHHFAPGTDRGAAVSQLASRAAWCVLVSATPHSGDQPAFDYLTAIGTTGESTTIFRRSRQEVGFSVSRRSHLLGVRTSIDESRLLIAVDDYARAIWLARGRDNPAVRLIAITMARRAASSICAIERTLQRRLDLLSSAAAEPLQPLLPWDDDDAADNLESDRMLATPGLENVSQERSALERLLVLTKLCGHNSKLHRLERLLTRIAEPAIVFTEYRDTLETVTTTLVRSRRVGAIHGGLPRELRRSIIDEFNSGRLDVLVATDAAGEGLNLHHRCRLVIDLELPWNPLRLEQRVGRVDRIGQRRIVHAIRMFHPDTIEDRVLEHLQLRQRRAESAFGDRVSEADVAAAVFDDIAVPAQTSRTLPTASVASAVEEAARAKAQRERRGTAVGVSRSWAAPRYQCTPVVLALQRITLTNRARITVGDVSHARRICLQRWPLNPGEWQRLIEHLAAKSTDLPGILESIAAVERERRPLQNAISRRIGGIRDRLARERSIEYQRSLFDARADADAAAREQLLVAVDRALSLTLERVVGPIDAEDVRIDFVAAWPERLT